MEKQKIKNRGGFYGEAIFHIAYHNLKINYVVGKRDSKRTISQVQVILNYLHNLPETSKEQVNGI